MRGVRQSGLRGRRAPENGRSGSSSALAFDPRELRILGLWDAIWYEPLTGRVLPGLLGFVKQVYCVEGLGRLGSATIHPRLPCHCSFFTATEWATSHEGDKFMVVGTAHLKLNDFGMRLLPPGLHG